MPLLDHSMDLVVDTTDRVGPMKGEPGMVASLKENEGEEDEVDKELDDHCLDDCNNLWNRSRNDYCDSLLIGRILPFRVLGECILCLRGRHDLFSNSFLFRFCVPIHPSCCCGCCGCRCEDPLLEDQICETDQRCLADNSEQQQ